MVTALRRSVAKPKHRQNPVLPVFLPDNRFGMGKGMYQIGELVQYGSSGVCKIEGIVQDVAGLDQDKQYYLMIPVNRHDSKIYTPVDNTKTKMRRILSAEEVRGLMEAAPKMEELSIGNEKQCEGVYKEALYSIDCYLWLRLLKTLMLRKAARMAQGKKCTATDERYLKSVGERLYDELSIVLGEEEAKESIHLLFGSE